LKHLKVLDLWCIRIKAQDAVSEYMHIYAEKIMVTTVPKF